MKNKQLSIFDLIVEIHTGLERQGPGSPEMTVKALSFLDNLDKNPRVADLACGTGGQTMVLAQNISGDITGLDFCTDFINVFNDNAKKEFDLIWSEGAIDNIGFEKGINYWNGFLKKNGYIAVTCPSWFTDERPAEIEKFWGDAGCKLDTTGHNILVMQKAGYIPVAAFTLPEKCWTDNYFIPREAALKALWDKYTGNKTVETFIENNRYEVELYSKYYQYYGYVFYIGKKI